VNGCWRLPVANANANANANEPSRDGNLGTRVCQSRANLSVVYMFIIAGLFEKLGVFLFLFGVCKGVCVCV
jgi:hypothetical protein